MYKNTYKQTCAGKKKMLFAFRQIEKKDLIFYFFYNKNAN